MTDYLNDIIAEGAHAAGKSDPEWKVTFSDGEQRVGVIEHIGGSAYKLTGQRVTYFSSERVVRLILLSAGD